MKYQGVWIGVTLLMACLWWRWVRVWHPAFMHWYARKRKLRHGEYVTWTRPVDGVLITGFYCKHCKLLFDVKTCEGSWKRYQREEAKRKIRQEADGVFEDVINA